MTSSEKTYTIDLWDDLDADVIEPVLESVYGYTLEDDDVDDTVIIWDDKTDELCKLLGINAQDVKFWLWRRNLNTTWNDHDHDPILLSDHPRMLILLNRWSFQLKQKDIEEHYEGYWKEWLEKDTICEKKEASV